jgi:riboflavin-specific deaminase-like protein
MAQLGRPVTALDDTEGAAAAWAWAVIRQASDLWRRGRAPECPAFYASDAEGFLYPIDTRAARPVLAWNPPRGWTLAAGCPAPARDLLELYLPFCGAPAGEGRTVGHLGQSLDGCIATRSGDSCHVTGHENIRHLHRMRALGDAVVVGADTVAADDPRLTTRLVRGGNPVRIVLDPRRRLHRDYRLFSDQAAPTLLVCREDHLEGTTRRHGQAEVLGLPARGGHLDLGRLLRELRRRGIRVIFVEGGGVTVTAFLQAGLLDRLQIAVAPLVIGNGRPGLQLPGTDSMDGCLRLRHRVFRMGEDILFDCELRQSAGNQPQPPASAALQRIL